MSAFLFMVNLRKIEKCAGKSLTNWLKNSFRSSSLVFAKCFVGNVKTEVKGGKILDFCAFND